MNQSNQSTNQLTVNLQTLCRLVQEACEAGLKEDILNVTLRHNSIPLPEGFRNDPDATRLRGRLQEVLGIETPSAEVTI